ncbi:MAG: hypothetical protein WBL40_15095 [Terrimicrobiaceae bacterium]
MDHSARLPAHRNGEGDVAAVVAHEHHVRGAIRAGGTHGQAHRSGGKGRRASFKPSPTMA